MQRQNTPTARGVSVLERPPEAPAPPSTPDHPAADARGIVLAILGVTVLSAIAARTIPDPALAWTAAWVLTVLVPGGLLASILLAADETNRVEWLLLALGLGTLALVASGLVLSYLPLPLSPTVVLTWFGGLALVLALAITRRRPQRPMPRSSRADRSTLLDCAIVLGLGAALRLPNLGYSEFQGDETEVILRAVGVVQNLPDALFYHGKGPAEVVVTAVLYGLVGTLSEASARLPFALAGLGGLAAFYLLARRLLGRPGALAAALLLAFNGYFVAFARIAQYQSLVFLMSVLAVWCAVRWAGLPPTPTPSSTRGEGSGFRWPLLTGAFAAIGALAHYDAVFALTPIALLALRPGGLRGVFRAGPLRAWLAGGAVGLALLLLFFGPYLANPLYELATDRLADRVGTGFPHNNLPSLAASAALYTSVFYLVILGLLVALGGVLLLTRTSRTSGPPAWVGGLALAWFAAPLLFYAFVARKPGTHIHVASTGLALLAGWTVASLWSWPAARIWRPALAGLLGASLAIVGAYLGPIYLQTAPELVRANVLGSFPLHWQVGDQVPRKERFGFPYEAGWKAIAILYDEGRLAGSYDSNENHQITRWYTRDAWRCTANPRYYLIAEGVQDELEPPRRRIAAEYPPTAVITVGGQPKLRVHEYGAPPGREPTVWPAEAFVSRFDRGLSGMMIDPGPWARGPIATEHVSSPASFGEAIDLLGYRLFAEDPRPGGVVRLDLYWSPRVSTNGGYGIDIQLGRDQRIGDGNGPGCDRSRATQEWTAGQPFAQRASVSIAPDARPGRHPLVVTVVGLGRRDGRLPVATTLPMHDGMVEIGHVDVGSD